MTHSDTVNRENPGPMTIRAAAEYLGVSTRTMSRRVSDGTIPAARIGGAVRIRPRDLDKLFTSTTAEGGR